MALGTVVLWALSAVLLAQLTWWLVLPATADKPQTMTGGMLDIQPSIQQSVDIGAIQSLNLFGASQQGAVSARRDAPKTALNIRLVGVSASSDPQRSAAIIEQAGEQQTYIVGDELGRSGVTVEAIYADRVMLDNNGRMETLQLEDIGEQRPALSLVVDDTAAPSEQRELPVERVDNALQEVATNPQSITDYVSISPAMDNGELIGYRLQAGQKPELFHQAGFQNGDLAVAINGYDLTDMQQAMALSNELTTLTRADIEILRDGQPMQLSIELTNKQDN